MKSKIVMASAAVLSVFALAACSSNADRNRVANNIYRTNNTSRPAATAAPRAIANNAAKGYGQGTDSSRAYRNEARYDRTFDTGYNRAYGSRDTAYQYNTGENAAHGLTNNIVRNTGRVGETVVNAADNMGTYANDRMNNQAANRMYNSTGNYNTNNLTAQANRATNYATQDTLYRGDMTNSGTTADLNNRYYGDTAYNNSYFSNTMADTGLNSRNVTGGTANTVNRPAGITPLTNNINTVNNANANTTTDRMGTARNTNINAVPNTNLNNVNTLGNAANTNLRNTNTLGNTANTNTNLYNTNTFGTTANMNTNLNANQTGNTNFNANTGINTMNRGFTGTANMGRGMVGYSDYLTY